MDTASKPLRLALVGASIVRETELPGFEDVTDFASESYNLAIGSLKASVLADAELSQAFELRLFDFGVTWDHKVLGTREAQAVADWRPDLLGLSCYCWSLHTLMDLAERVRDSLPQTFLFAGGPSVGPAPEESLDSFPALDAIASGEGESVLLALLRAHAGHGNLAEVPGLTWRDSEEVRVNPLPDKPVDLAQLPSPYRSGVLSPGASSFFLETSRGCRYRCRFCSWMGVGRALRYTPIEHVEADLRWALERGSTSIKLADTAINFHTERVAELAQVIRRVDPGQRLRFTYFLKPELLEAKQVEMLRGIPTDEIIIGLESIHADVRRGIGKPAFDPEEFEERMSLLRQVGPVTVSLIMGLPGDSPEGLDQTLAWVRDFDASHPGWMHEICLFWLAVLPGSNLYKNREKHRYRVMPRGTPYVLDSKHAGPADLVRMARISAQAHYAHPKLRVEFFHKEYLNQDAPAVDHLVAIPRWATDTRPRVLVLGLMPRSWEPGWDLTPYSLAAAGLKAYAESQPGVLEDWNICLTNLSADEKPDPRLLLAEGEPPEFIILCNETGEPDAPQSFLEALDPLGCSATIYGTGSSETLQQRESPAKDAADLEPELHFLALLGQDHAQGSLEHLDAIPSPLLWGMILRGGPQIALRLGRIRPGHDSMECFSPQRIRDEIRWAVEERKQEILWLHPIPQEPEIQESFLAAIAEADPQQRLLHRFTSRAEKDPGLRGFVQALSSSNGSSSPAQVLEARRIEEMLSPWKRGGTLDGWILESVDKHSQHRELRVQVRQDDLPAWVTLAPGLEPVHTQSGLRIEVGSSSRQLDAHRLRRLGRLVDSLLKRNGLGERR